MLYALRFIPITISISHVLLVRLASGIDAARTYLGFPSQFGISHGISIQTVLACLLADDPSPGARYETCYPN